MVAQLEVQGTTGGNYFAVPLCNEKEISLREAWRWKQNCGRHHRRKRELGGSWHCQANARAGGRRGWMGIKCCLSCHLPPHLQTKREGENAPGDN